MSIFELIMLSCFGASWPIALAFKIRNQRRERLAAEVGLRA